MPRIDGLRRMGEVRANGLEVTDPRVSPVYGNLSGLGRVTLTTGTREILYPDTLLLANKLKQAGVDCNLVSNSEMILRFLRICIPMNCKKRIISKKSRCECSGIRI